MDKQLTLGSLFSGSGGFELGGLLCGITPLWASEVEPFPIRVTTKRLPQVKHLGDTNQINGAKVLPVDIITGGFCCQDLSVAGKRLGLHGERSGLFFQNIRIIKEMRAATQNAYPKFAILENVPGIYNSAGGADFLEVLNELIKIKDQTLSVPMPESGKWSTAGEIVGDGFSLGWRTLDAQFWGVAQRRRRCFIVLDLAGERAGKILFDETRLRGNPPPGRFPWQAAAGDSEAGSGITVPCLNDQGGSKMDVSENVTGTLRAQEHGHHPIVFESAGFCTEHSAKAYGVGFENEKSPTLRSSVVPAAVVYDARGNGDGDVVNTITGDHNGHISDYTALAVTPTAFGISSYESNAMKSPNPAAGIYEAVTARTIDTSGGNPGCNQGGIAVVFDGKQVTSKQNRSNPQPGGPCHTLASGSADSTVICLEGNGTRPSHKGSGVSESGVSFSLNTVEQHGVAYAMTTGCYTQVCKEQSPTLQARDYKDAPVVNRSKYIVRRLTPTECASLQGFPPWWCAGLETPNPTEDDVAFWSEVWETHRCVIGKSSKPKTRAQIIKWLKNPHSDSKEYAMWGNGVCVNIVVMIMQGIKIASEGGFD